MNQWLTIRQVRFGFKPLVFILALLPFALAVAWAFGLAGGLGANPVEQLLDHFGNWGLYFVMIVLAVTPLREATGQKWLARLRRPLGLFAFFYVLMHFLVYLILDQGLASLAFIVEDIVERPFITLGIVALLLLSAMAATSSAAARRALGARWQKLHYAAYAVGILGVWHYWWQVKKDLSEPLLFAAILAVLLGWRLLRRRLRQPRGNLNPA